MTTLGGPALTFLRTVLLCLAAWVPVYAAAQPRFDFATTETVLPKTVVPSHVRLSLDVDPARDTFGGVAVIQVRVLAPVATILVHAKELEPLTLQLLGDAGPRVLVLREADVPETWRLAPQDGAPIAPGDYRLSLAYRGRVRQSGEGLFAAGYVLDGQPARMLATQMEPAHARRVFPGFDEPVFRTSFEVDVRAPAGLEVLSNMPRTSATAEGDAVRHRFAATPPMQSYLLSVSVGRFDVLEDAVDGIPLRIFTTPGKREHARFAMSVTRQVLPYYRRYFGQPYALPKLDQLAVPSVRVGAMEDWGLISYQEDALLVDPQRQNSATLQTNFSLIAHEIAHQWFGNLVSPASWSEIWLNEAFATWMERKARAHFHPEWAVPLRVRRRMEAVLDRDATPATRAIRSGPVNEAAVNDVFDNITYQKGGAVLTMLEQWLGEEDFQRGMAGYMAERAMRPATAGDLWHHMGKATGKPVAAVAATWTDQPGLPLVELAARCESGATVATLRQARFATLDALPAGTWIVPVRLSRGSELRTELLDSPRKEVRWPGCTDEPLLGNAGGLGYYRVDHDEGLRARLTASFPRLSATDRVAVLADSFALAVAGRRPLAAHLDLIAAVRGVQDESRPALYVQAIRQWGELETTFSGTPAQAALQKTGQAFFAPEMARLGWRPVAGESSDSDQLRSRLIQHLAHSNHAPTLATARELFAPALAADLQRVPPSMRSAVLWAGGWQASEAEFESLLQALRTSSSQAERFTMLNSLAAGQDPTRARRLLKESLSGRLPGDISVALPAAVGAHPVHGPMVYEFVSANWGALSRLAGDNTFAGRQWLLPRAAEALSELESARRLLHDQQREMGGVGAANAERAAAAIRLRHTLRVREAAALPGTLEAWLAALKSVP